MNTGSFRFCLIFFTLITSAVLAANTDKTLISWVKISNKHARAGSIITIQDGEKFDGIIFAERAAGRWMAGSEYFSRTEKNQNGNPVEKANRNALVQMAIVYKGDQVSIYRNGKAYVSYKAKNIDLLTSKENFVVFGLRHVGGNGSIVGSIEDARIYNRALSVKEINSLEPNKESSIRPYAWWDFEGNIPVERTGRYPFNNLENGGKLEDGSLILKMNAAFVSARVEKRVTKIHKPMTPAIPNPLPKTWLTYHLAHPGPDKAIPADPNCAIYYKGRYHLHYIFQNQGHSFAHVSSKDMVHWQWHTTTLTPPITGHGMFSGTAFMTTEGKPAIIYHGQGSGRNQISLAMDDTLEKWSEAMAVEPQTADGKAAKLRHWDPDCWLSDGSYFSIAGGSNPTLSKSKDLRNWEFQGELFHPDFPDNLGVAKGEDTSCANMFKIGDKWMLLCISHGLGCRYYLGDFKDGKYLPEHHALMNWAKWDFFAPESLLTPDGRRVMWAWCTPWVNNMQRVGREKDFDALMNGKIQPGIQSLPRELSLPDDGVLRIRPLHELEQLRSKKKEEENITIKGNTTHILKNISGDTMELEITFAAPSTSEFGVKVLSAKDGSQGFKIASGKGNKTLEIGYVRPPFELRQGEDLVLRVFIDKSMIEVFANDRQAAVAWHEYDPKDLHVSLFSKDGDVKIKKVTAWMMNSIYDGDTFFKP